MNRRYGGTITMPAAKAPGVPTSLRAPGWRRLVRPERIWLTSWLHIAWVVAAVGGVMLLGCRGADSSRPAVRHYPLGVVCTTGYVADLLRQVGGTHVQVEALMSPGVDPHLYKVTPRDVRKLSGADAVFYNGLHLEGRLADLLEKLARQKPVFAVTAARVAQRDPRLRRMPGTKDVYDPHVWFDAGLWAQCALDVAEQLAALDPQHAGDFRASAAAYAAQLRALDAECRRRLAEIPAPRRVLVTAHDAFGYFGAAYGVEVRGLQGISTADEAALAAVNQLVDLLVERRVKAVFVESSVPPKNVQALVEACAACGHRLAVGGELYSDALGPQGTPEATYVGAMRYNLTTIVAALK